MNILKFRRQFLFTAKKCKELQDWNIDNLESHYLYTHPDCEKSRIQKESLDLILIGYIINPRLPDNSSSDILADISNFISIDDVSKKLYGLVGRFILIIKKDNQYTFFNDACGLKLLFYTKYNEELYAASQPLLLRLVCDIQESSNHQEYYRSTYVKDNIEHYIPSGTSLYENVHHLVPNHYLSTSNLEQKRYWPVKQLQKESLRNSVDDFSNLLKNTMLAANKKFKLALPLTAGWDSRMVLSGCKSIHRDLWCYTLQYRDLTIKSNDLRIPSKIATTLGLQYEIIDCRKSLNNKFVQVYMNNTDIPHLNDWGKIANGMFEKYPSDRIAVKGVCSEIGRCYYPRNKKHRRINSSEDLLDLEYQWNNISFIQKRMLEWFDEVKNEKVNFGYNIYDLFFWEHRMGSWQAQSQLEWDIVQDAFTPFNNREILDIMLRIDPLHRSEPDFELYKESMEKLWPEVLSESINPLSKNETIRKLIKSLMMNLGILNLIKKVVRRIK